MKGYYKCEACEIETTYITNGVCEVCDNDNKKQEREEIKMNNGREWWGRKIKKDLDNKTTEQLKDAINQGLSELRELVTKKEKPENYENELDLISLTLQIIDDELTKRGKVK